MNRGQHARANEEGPHQAQREGDDGEQDRPHLQRVALFHHQRRMEQRGARKPGHEGGVLDRIPEPETAPAELVIGPPRAHGDAEREAHPGGKRPGSDPARPGGVDTAVDQGGDGKGEGHGEADIAGIEEGRVEGERRVLKDRVQPLSVEGGRVDADERIGGRDDEKEKGRRDRALHRKHVGLELPRQIGAIGRDARAEQREDQDPQHHRTLVVSPHARDFVEQRLGRVGVAPDIQDREVRGYVSDRQRSEGNRHQNELHLRRRGGDGGKLRVAQPRADQRQRGLHDGDGERQDQRIVTGLCNHGPPSITNA